MSTQITELKIKTYPAPILRKKVKSVDKVTQDERDILSMMARFMYETQGVGLAGNQVGINKALLVADPGNSLYKLINPKVVKRKGESILEEGCLSIPGVCLKIKRAKSVIVRAQDESGKLVTIKAEGLLSHILQHEIDHLNGKMIVDRASFFSKLKIRGKLRRLSKEDEKVCQSERESCKLQL